MTGSPAWAATFTINTEADLRAALNPTTGAQNGDTISFNANVTLSADLPIVQHSVTIVGDGHTLSGGNAYRGLLVYSGTVSISNLTIQNTKAQGGAGLGSAGGGAGLGGALFVANGANVTVTGVAFTSNSAGGGAGGVGAPGGGGGGMGGNGGLGKGGSVGGASGGGGGGLGSGANGGNYGGHSGTSGIATGRASGGGGANSSSTGGTDGGGGGGGGHSFYSGGGGGIGGGNGTGTGGGAGGFGGGGGGGGISPNGNGGGGGFGGGGGGGNYAGSNGGLGGLGGGGGGGAYSKSGSGGTGASGGFGGGGGGNGGTGGFGGGGGGGGAGMGGAIFVQDGGHLTVGGTLSVTGGTVSGGAGGAFSGSGAAGNTAGSAGLAYGSGIFLQGSGTVTFSPGAGETQTVSDAIADEAGSGGSAASTWTLSKTGVGILVLSGTNTYSGGTTVSGGTLSISADANLGNGGTLALENGTTLLLTAGGTYTHGITVAGDPTFDVAAGQTVTQSGVIADGATAGDVTKTGAGTLVLSAANSYSGGTVVDAGTLELSGSGTLGSNAGALTVNGGTLDLGGTAQTVGSLSGTGGAITLGSGALTVNQSSDTSYSGAISGSGSLTKAGAGTLILDGANTYTGGTTVSGGTLEIGDVNNPGASIAGNVTVDAGGTLAGHGTIGGDVINSFGGIVSPGGTIGTLSVGGNYTQGSTSALSIEVSPTAASKLEIGGTATLAGTLKLVYDPGVYNTMTYDIVHADSVTGTFSTVTGAAPAGVSQAIDYTATDVKLALTRSGTLVVAPTEDTGFTALGTAALQGAQQTNTALFGHLAALHSGTGSETIHTALASTDPAQLAFNGSAQDLNGMLANLPDAVAQMGGWFRALGNFASLDGSAGASGFDTQSGGFLAGIDRPVSDHLMLGVAGGYIHTNLSVHDGESGSLDTPRLMLYGSYALGPWSIDATAGYAHDFIDAARPIASLGQTASSSHGAEEATGAVQATRRFDLGGVTLLPAAGLQYVHLFDGGFSESGAPGFDLQVSSRNADSLRPFVGLSAAKVFTTESGTQLVPEADVSYSHELFNTPPSLVQVGGGSFSVDGIAPSRDEVALGGGVTAQMSDRLAFYADYHANLPTGNLFQQTIEAGLSYNF